ncbi:MAG TPA: RNA polymerase sigma factor [Candidatus Limnocylindrales bacterium]|jgi:RNA polymerase sigma-70 factor (ECF subfamily)
MELLLTSPGGQRALLDEQYGHQFRDLVRLCRALGAGPDAEDIAQETLLYARDHIGALRDAARLGAWLRRIAARKTARRVSRGRRHEELRDVVFAPIEPGLGIDLAAAIERLPERQRVVLALVYGLGYSQQQTADCLGIKRGTVAATLYAARGQLARALVDYWESR